MRPLRLSIEGLRSYRKRVEIDFTGKELVAIVGDTGAGKSSVLEAITYALYNATTWDQARVKDLISDGSNTMSVVLEFEADGRTWRVHRSTSRTAYPPSVHRLECLGDRSEPKRDGERETSEAVGRLVGMSYKAFKSAVLLPQGEFQELLEASAGDRVKILEGIFRLDDIREARNRADLFVKEVEPLVLAIRGRRHGYLDDPARTAAEAAAGKDRAASREKELAKLGKKVKGFADLVLAAERRRKELEQPAERLVKVVTDAAQVLSGLLPVEREIASQEKSLEAERKEREKRLAGLEKDLKDRESAGESVKRLHEARLLATQVHDDLERVAATRSRLAAEETILAGRARVLETSARSAEELRQVADAARSEAVSVDERVKGAVLSLHQAETCLREFRKAESDEKVASKAAKDAAASSKKAAAAETEAVAARDAATAELEASMVREAEAARADLVAHAAHGLEAGDACPICRQDLPKGFRAPKAPALEEARAAVARAKARADEAVKQAVEAGAEARAATLSLEGFTRQAEAATERRKETGRRLAEFSDVDVAFADAAILASLAETHEALEKESAAKRAAAGEARAAAERAAAAFEGDSATLERDRKRWTLEKAEADALDRQCADRMASLSELSGTKEASVIAAKVLLARLEGKLEDGQKLVARRDEERERVAGLAREHGNVAARREKEVEVPRRKAAGGLDNLFTRLNDALESLGQPTLTSPGAATLEEQVAWARELDGHREKITERFVAAIGEARDAAVAAENDLREVLEAGAFRDVEDLEEARVMTLAQIQRLERERAEAEAQIPVVAELDRAETSGEELLGALKELRGLLGDGNFVNHVVQRRQKNLLAVASEILSSMTGSRYGFSPDFQVIDKTSHQPRSTKTLSGGESFLASLALALGLVEIAGRAGGRLDALFLDEGFGALDANALDEALSALETRAKGGRLVAVVSHLKAVAERIETVLSVKRTASGSEIRWADSRDRDELVDEELESGLLT